MSTEVPSIEPTTAQFERIAAAANTDDKPVWMLNLLRFKDVADGIHEGEGLTGAEAYARYGVAVQRFLERAGGRVVLAAKAGECVIGPPDGEWDAVFVVEYPSRRAFLQMTSDPDYLEIHAHRAAGLADSRLIACKPMLS